MESNAHGLQECDGLVEAADADLLDTKPTIVDCSYECLMSELMSLREFLELFFVLNFKRHSQVSMVFLLYFQFTQKKGFQRPIKFIGPNKFAQIDTIVNSQFAQLV